MKFIFGLGNPGSQYNLTRHNIGKLILDELADENSWYIKDNLFEYCELEIYNQECMLIKPLCYMNNSGYIYKKLLTEETINSSLTVVDDFLLNFGKLRYRVKGSNGGHNGLKSIEKYFGLNFQRLRIGIGPIDDNNDPSDFVLSNFIDFEKLKKVMIFAADSIRFWIENNIIKAMNKFNGLNIFEEDIM